LITSVSIELFSDEHQKSMKSNEFFKREAQKLQSPKLIGGYQNDLRNTFFDELNSNQIIEDSVFLTTLAKSLFIAVEDGVAVDEKEILKLIRDVLSNNNVSMEIHDERGYNAIHWAVEANCVELVKELYKIFPFSLADNSSNADYETPLEIAKRNLKMNPAFSDMVLFIESVL